MSGSDVGPATLGRLKGMGMTGDAAISKWSAFFSAVAAVLAGGALASVGYIAMTLGAHGERLEQAIDERAEIAARFDHVDGHFDDLMQQIRALDRSIQAQQTNVHDVLAHFGIISPEWPPIETVVIGDSIYMFPKNTAQHQLLRSAGFEQAQIGDTTIKGFRVGSIDLVLPDQR